VKLLRTSRREPSEAIAALTDRRNARTNAFSRRARRIVESVRRGGDPALLRLPPNSTELRHNRRYEFPN